jgi:3-methyladenine DNA glycosylase AlkD
MNISDVEELLHFNADPLFREKMKRFSIPIDDALGISMPKIRSIAKQIGKNHQLSIDAWGLGIHESRILATLIADPIALSSDLMNTWALDFNSWDICDQACSNLFNKSPFCIPKIEKWKTSDFDFVKRAAFVMMATTAMHHKSWDDSIFIQFLKYCEQECCDNRNFVKKAINWAVRQIGKKNEILHSAAIQTVSIIAKTNCKSALWIATDAKKELESEKLLERLKRKRD